MQHDADKVYPVNVEPQANEMLYEHVAFLTQVSEGAAQKLIESFKTNVDSLTWMSDRYALLDADGVPKNRYRSLLFEKRYRILYSIQDDIVHIEAVMTCLATIGVAKQVNCRQDFTRFL
jgi:hypothetical protein